VSGAPNREVRLVLEAISSSDSESKKYGDPPTVEAWTTAITNMPAELGLQMRDHAIRSLKNDTRWSDYVTLAERILRERASRESSTLNPTTMIPRECKVGLSLRGAYQAAFQKEADSESSKQPIRDQVRLRRVAQVAFETLEKHEVGCLTCRGTSVSDIRPTT
jgi:hypothetical protein